MFFNNKKTILFCAKDISNMGCVLRNIDDKNEKVKFKKGSLNVGNIKKEKNDGKMGGKKLPKFFLSNW